MFNIGDTIRMSGWNEGEKNILIIGEEKDFWQVKSPFDAPTQTGVIFKKDAHYFSQVSAEWKLEPVQKPKYKRRKLCLK